MGFTTTQPEEEWIEEGPLEWPEFAPEAVPELVPEKEKKGEPIPA